jgi:hypothetical protein
MRCPAPGVTPAFSGITAFSLFPRIHAALKADGDQPAFSPRWCAVAYFVLSVSWRLPEPYWLVSFLWFLPIVPIQQAINANARKHNPRADLNANWEWWSFLLIALGGALVLLTIIAAFLPEAGE